MTLANPFQDAEVLVTGGAGAIGSATVRSLVEAGAVRIIVVDDMSSGYRWNIVDDPAIEVWEMSILDDQLYDRLRRERFDFIFHFAALFANQNSIEHPHQDLSVNGMGTLRMLEVARDHGCRRFVYASSSSSFSKAEAPLPLHEDFVSLKLDTPYQISKLLGEYYCNYFLQFWNVPTVSCRLFNSYGPGEVPGRYRNVIPNFIHRALQGEALPITGTGEETRDFTFVQDIVNGLLAAAVCPDAVGEAFNLASSRETRIIDLATTINELTGNPGGIVFKPRRDWDHTSRRWASTDKAFRVLGYRPQTTLADGLPRAIAWFQEHWDRIAAAVSAQSPAGAQSGPIGIKVAA